MKIISSLFQFGLLLACMALLVSGQSVAAESDSRTGVIRGIVLDAASLEPLTGVNVILEGTNTGTATDIDGRFQIAQIPVGVHTLRFQYLGFETRSFTDIVVSANRPATMEVRLRESAIVGQELTVTAGFFQRDEQNPLSSVSFNPEELRRSPGSGQELSRIIAALPGVASAGDVSQDIMVRGGSPNENAFYIDHILMPGVAHFTLPGGSSNGPIGIVNTDLIADVTFSSGAYPASYGGFLSSVTEITYREGNRNGFQGDAQFSMAGLGINAEGGLLSGSGSYIISARRSYLDLIASAINAGGAPRYSDLQGKITLDASKTHRFNLLMIYGNSLFTSTADDASDAGIDETFRTENNQITVGVSHRYIWRRNGYTISSVSLSAKHDDVLGLRISDGSTSERFDISNRYIAVRSLSRYTPHRRLSIETGAEGQLETHNYDYFVDGFTHPSGFQRDPFSQEVSVEGFLGSLFASATWRAMPRLAITGGLRTSYTEYNGEVTWSPRFSAVYALTSRLDLSAAAGIFHQPNTRYLLSQSRENRQLRNMRAVHYTAGIGYQLTDDTRLTAEVYTKNYDRIPSFSDPSRTDVLPEYLPDNFIGIFDGLDNSGIARSYGTDILLQKKLAVNFYGMVSLSWFRSEYRDHTGTWQDRRFNNRYLASVIGGYRPTDRYEFSARWSYQGGRPYTPFDEPASEAAGAGIADITRFNAAQMPAFHSLYLRADRRVFYERSSLITFIELWNTYGRRNVAGYYWSSSANRVEEVRQFGFIPVGGVKFEF